MAADQCQRQAERLEMSPRGVHPPSLAPGSPSPDHCHHMAGEIFTHVYRQDESDLSHTQAPAVPCQSRAQRCHVRDRPGIQKHRA